MPPISCSWYARARCHEAHSCGDHLSGSQDVSARQRAGRRARDVVELLKMSPYRPNLIVMDGRIYIWLRVNYMPLPQCFSELSAGKRSDSVDEGTASQARPRYGDCRPDAVGWPRLSGHRYGDWSNSVLKCAPKRQVRAHRDAKHPICVPMCAESSVRARLRTQTERQRCATIHIGRATLRGMATSRPRPESRLPRAWR